VGGQQVDQIGRIFAYWAIVFFGPANLKIPNFAKIFGPLIQRKKVFINFFKKMDWATF
jgi:hypothetical protein